MPDDPFRRLWAAYAVSTLSTFVALDALPLLAILVLRSGPSAVSLLAAAGPAAGALIALPLGPWVELRGKRRVMVTMDAVRGAVLIGLVVAFRAGRLAFWQLLVATVVVAACANAHRAASGAWLKEMLGRDELLRANVRLEATTWTATVLGPPAGGAAIGVFGPIVTVGVDACSYLLSALGLRGVRETESAVSGPAHPPSGLLGGWRLILASPTLRPLFANTVLVNGLIMATAPLMAVLMLGRLGFAPWQYGLAFGLPCVGGLLGSRLARPLARRFGGQRVLLAAGAARACWSVGLAAVQPGVVGLVTVLVVQFGLVTSIGVFNPLLATARLEQAPPGLVARVLSAWSVGSTLTVAALTALFGVLAEGIGARAAVAAAGVLMLATPLLLPSQLSRTGRLRRGVSRGW